jgi:putative transcriptional regulator
MRRSKTRGDAFYQPVKRPTGFNPMRDPLVVAGVIGRRRSRRLRARDRREFEPVDVREIRAIFTQTRREFATMMGISHETLRNWERGRRFPQGPARALLRIAKANPDLVAAVLVRARIPWGRIPPD